ncbi:MAG TPA: alpha/beta fold hydrolase [Tepidisphaeraceae bacterium]|nr:alpha/beta fold hydrolase [Tepidisphaeraceae bacterium]
MRLSVTAFLVAPILSMLLAVAPVAAAEHECRIPLRDGRLSTRDLSAALLEKCRIKGVELNAGSVDLSGVNGWLFIQAMNTALGDGCHVARDGNELLLRVDTQKLPKDFDALRKATRVFAATAAPIATADQRRSYGLFLPKEVDVNRPMVVLVHGLDCNRANWFPMADLIVGEGFQVAYFTYPSDQPLEDSAEMLGREMNALRETFPHVKIDVIAHSMGGLIARRYVEGDSYAGGVDRFIMIGTPNLGTRWASYRWALEVQEHYQLWKTEPGWSPTWMITDGLGEAGRDLKPTSRFLKQLNERPRRDGVKYTVIAGSQHPVNGIAANALDGAANIIPDRAAKWWGFRQTEAALERGAEKLRHRTGKSDGPVNLKSTQLQGVEDHVVLAADHTALYYPVNGQAPAAWAVIKERLAN